MAETAKVIEIAAEVTVKTSSGAKTAENAITKIEKAVKKLDAELNKLKGKSKIEIAVVAVDKASRVVDKVWQSGKKIAGKVWTITLKAIDLAAAPLRELFKMLTSPAAKLTAGVGISLNPKEMTGASMQLEQQRASIRSVIDDGTKSTSQTDAGAFGGSIEPVGAARGLTASGGIDSGMAGAAERMSNIRLDALQGSMTLSSSAAAEPKNQISEVVRSPEFHGDGLFENAGLLWDELIWEPLSAWYNGGGRDKLVGVA
ncbi:MAG: hypothetical protein LBQ91_06270, partial [Oscillospiraceae bacterium]|nr:hypothetical protein [Oscillospiraceae bacterium]